MLRRVLVFGLGIAVVGLGILCTQPVNPYLETGIGELVFPTMPITEGTTVRIFSTIRFSVEVRSPDDVASVEFGCPGNRLWSGGDTLISGSGISGGPITLAISVKDTGAHQLVAVLRRVGGDSVSTAIGFHAISPLNQETIRASVGDTVVLGTDPVADEVLYVWTFPNGTAEKNDSAHTRLVVRTDFTFGFGELYVKSGADVSPVQRFAIIVQDKMPPTIACLTDSLRGDTITTGSRVTRLGFTVHDETSQLGPVTLNGRESDSSVVSDPNRSAHYWAVQQPDTLTAAFMIRVEACDAEGNCRSDTFFVRYDPATSETPKPSLVLSVPSADSQTVGDSLLVVRGLLNDIDTHDSLFVFALLNGVPLAQPAVVGPASSTFAFPLALTSGLNQITLIVSRIAEPGIDTLAQGGRVVIYTPGIKDIHGPVIVSVRHLEREIGESYTTDSASITISVVSYDAGLGLRGVTVNGRQATYRGNDLFIATASLSHGIQGNPVVITATDSAGNETSTAVRIFRNSAPKIVSMPSVAYIRALSPYVDSIKWSDADQDSITASLLISASGRDTLLYLGKNGGFSWVPALPDTAAPVRAVVKISDGYTAIDSAFILIVQPPRAPPVVPARFTIRVLDFPESLMIGRDTLRKVLTIDKSNASGEYLFYARVQSTGQVLLNNTLDSLLIWIPPVRDTGRQTLELIVRSGQGLADTLRPVVRVVPPPPPVTVSFERNIGSGSERIPLCSLKLVLSQSRTSSTRIGFEILTSSTAKPLVNYRAPDSTAVYFAAGSRTQYLVFAILHDPLPSGNKNIDIRITSASNGVVLGALATTTYIILDSDTAQVVADTPAVSFIKSDSMGNEGTYTLNLGVRLSRKATIAGTVRVSTGGSAVRGADFVLLDSLVSFAAGESLKTVRYRILDDSICEMANETIVLSLVSPINVRLGTRPSYVYTLLPSDSDRCRKKIAHVVGGGSFTRTDSLIADSLDRWGYSVTRLRAGQVTATNIRDADLIFISQSVSGATPGDAVVNSGLPIVCANGEDYVKLGLAHATDTGSVYLASMRVVAKNVIFSPFPADTLVRLSTILGDYPLVETPLNSIILTVRNIDPAWAGIFGFERGARLINGVTIATRRCAFAMAGESGGNAIPYTPIWYELLKHTLAWAGK